MIVRKFLRNVPAVVGLAIVAIAVLVAVFAWQLVGGPDPIFNSNLLTRLQPPSFAYPFGTDELGRNILARVTVGTRSALTLSLGVVALSTAIGVPLGLYAGYVSGVVSEAIMRITDVFLAVPQLILALAVAQVLSRGPESIIIALGLTYWPLFTRTVFAEVQRLKKSLFVEALEGLGASRTRIIVLHLLPNVTPSIIVRATIGLGFIILTAATLGFLGIGATPPDPDWGLAISESRQYLPESWWLATFPGVAILLTVLGFNLLGDGLRDLVDPKIRRSR